MLQRIQNQFMGQSNGKQLSRNILILGITLLLDLKLLNSEWVKDQNNSSQDFSIYINNSGKQKMMLWCPRDNLIIQQTLESVILNIDFEGVIYIFEQTSEPNKMVEHSRKIKWLMSEDSMRQCSLIVIAIAAQGNENQNIDIVKAQLEIELEFDSMDSKQARHLIIKQREKDGQLNFSRIVNQLMRMKNEL